MAIECNRDSRMGLLYKKYLEELNKLNLKQICLFSSVGKYTKYGSWGLKEN